MPGEARDGKQLWEMFEAARNVYFASAVASESGFIRLKDR